VIRTCGDANNPCGNSITYSGCEAVNFSVAQSDLGLFIPFIWPSNASQSPPPQAITWDNSRHGLVQLKLQ